MWMLCVGRCQARGQTETSGSKRGVRGIISWGPIAASSRETRSESLEILANPAPHVLYRCCFGFRFFIAARTFRKRFAPPNKQTHSFGANLL
jgi:hypothetical protein